MDHSAKDTAGPTSTKGGKVRHRAALVLCFVFLICGCGWARVLLRWDTGSLPPASKLGVRDLVIPWNSAKLLMLTNAVRSGYRVYAQTDLTDASAAAKSGTQVGIAGIIAERGDESREGAETKLRRLRAQYPSLTFWLVNPNALQPKMRGTLVINHNGILQATSPTAQPWVDTNLALISLERAFLPHQPAVYSFAWELNGIEQKQGPEIHNYALAISEAGAFQADVVLHLHENLMRGLAQDDSAAWELWRQELKYLQFYQGVHTPWSSDANVALVAKDDPSSFEPLNLLVRHNVGVRVFPPASLSQSALRGFRVAVVLATPKASAAHTILQFARLGGTAVLLNAERQTYPWHSVKPSHSSESSVTYSIAKGRIIELLQPISDPESFAQDIRALVPNDDLKLSLWNALTVVGMLRPSGEGKVIELLNYAVDPLDVQIQVKGEYDSVTFESPEHGCCTHLTPSIGKGFTEFTVPSLYIAGRVRLEGKAPETSGDAIISTSPRLR